MCLYYSYEILDISLRAAFDVDHRFNLLEIRYRVNIFIRLVSTEHGEFIQQLNDNFSFFVFSCRNTENFLITSRFDFVFFQTIWHVIIVFIVLVFFIFIIVSHVIVSFFNISLFHRADNILKLRSLTSSIQSFIFLS